MVFTVNDDVSMLSRIYINIHTNKLCGLHKFELYAIENERNFSIPTLEKLIYNAVIGVRLP